MAKSSSARRSSRKRVPFNPALASRVAHQDAGRLAEAIVVLSQTHRRGNTDQKCASALGRFVMAYKLRSEIYDAGQEYLEVTTRWRGAKGIPTSVHAGGGGCGLGPTDETVDDWSRRINNWHAAINGVVSKWGLPLMRSLVLDDEYPPAADAILTQATLVELAYATGRLGKNCHPFV